MLFYLAGVGNTMILVDAESVHAALTYDVLVAALRDAHENDVDAVESCLLSQPSHSADTDHFLSLPAWQRGRGFGAKLVSVFPDNEKNGSGLPSVQGVFVLFDGRSGSPRAVIDGAAITLRKTAADSGVGAHFLARNDAESLLMVGAGAMAPHLIMAHVAARPSIRNVQVWNRSPERARNLADALDIDGVAIGAIEELEAAARVADVISCATMAVDPLIRGAWLKPGAHLDLVGSFRTDMHECDTDALVRGSVFVDSPWSAIQDSGEIVTALASGKFHRDDVLASNFDLARGTHPGRTHAGEITVYKNGGGGHLDLMVAQILMDRLG